MERDPLQVSQKQSAGVMKDVESGPFFTIFTQGARICKKNEIKKSVKDEDSILHFVCVCVSQLLELIKTQNLSFLQKFCQNRYHFVNRAGFLNLAFPDGNLFQWKSSARPC